MSGKFALNTSVSIDKSKAELEWLLQRYGATEFAYMKSPTKAMIGFMVKGRRIQLTLELPNPKEFERSERGRVRTQEAAYQAWEQACRGKWRALVLIVKAKLEGIECGIVNMDSEFLAYTSLPNGKTIGDMLEPQIQRMVESGKVPALMPGGGL